MAAVACAALLIPGVEVPLVDSDADSADETPDSAPSKDQPAAIEKAPARPRAKAKDRNALAYKPYASSNGGWRANVPAHGGWSGGIETQINPGLFRTQFDGPGDSSLTVDATPGEAPSFGDAPVEARTIVDHPVFGDVERVVFQGDSNFDICERGMCVDFLIRDDVGGFAVLAGGPDDFEEIEQVAMKVMLSLRSL